MTIARTDQPEGVRFFLVAYEKGENLKWCKDPMLLPAAEKMVATIESAGVRAKLCEVHVNADSFDDIEGRCTFQIKSVSHPQEVEKKKKA